MNGATSHRLIRAGRLAWGFVGLALATAVVLYVLGRLSLLVVPVLLALFPATLLVPVAAWLRRRGAPDALAAIGALVIAIVLIGGVFAALVPFIAGELPDLVEAAGEGLARVQETVEAQFGIQIPPAADMLQSLQEGGAEAGEVAGQAVNAAVAAAETLTAIVLLVVVLFFYLKDGPRLVNGLLTLVPTHLRHHARALTDRSWYTLGTYFRGQLLVALADAVLIGAGLLIVKVPLAVPLSVLIFFGGLFPIVGAVVTGALAVLVALADQGLVAGLIVLAIVVGVQQLEGNVLEPLILGRAIHLHPVIVLLSITAGALLLGILGAFLAVPVAAVLARAVEYVRDQQGDPAGEGAVPAQPRAAD